jgi:hypothetical protein
MNNKFKTNNKEQENVEPDTSHKDNTAYEVANNRSSFIWNYLEKLSPSGKYKKRVKCLVPVGPRGERPCGHIMGSL